MKIIDPGHKFELFELDNPTTKNQIITYVKREGVRFPGNIGHYPGTTMQETARSIISRLRYVNNQIPHERNKIALYHFSSGIMQLELRAAERHNRKLDFDEINEHIEKIPYCLKCGHIGCVGECH